MTEVLQPTNAPLMLPGPVSVGTNFLRLADNIQPDQAQRAFNTLRTMNACRLWFCGDYILEIQRLKKIRSQEDKIQEVNTTTLGQAMDYQPNTISRAVMVCKALPPDKRITQASFTHHQAALDETGYDNPAKAIKWIRESHAHNWSVARMREEIRTRTGTGNGARPPNNTTGVAMLYKAATLTKKIPAHTLPQRARETLRKDLIELRQWLNAL